MSDLPPPDPVELARAIAEKYRTAQEPVAAPSSGDLAAGGATDPVAMARRIAEMARTGKLPSEKPSFGTEYGIGPATMHGLTMGASDIGYGYLRDIVQGTPWGKGAEDIAAAREQFATEHPYQNIAGNVVGGMAMPLGPLVKAGEYIAPAVARGLEALGLGSGAAAKIGTGAGAVGTGAGIGAGTGAITGLLDEFTGGREKMLEGAGQGALFGGLLGGAAPPVIAGGLGVYRAGKNFVGPQNLFSRGPALESAARQLQGAAEDLPSARLSYSGASPIREWDPSLAQLTGDPGLTRMEGDIVARISSRDPATWTPAEQSLAARAGEQGAARTTAIGTVADPNANPLAAQTAMQREATALAAKQQADLAAAQQAAEQQRAGAGLDIPNAPEVRGDAIKTELEAAKEKDKRLIAAMPAVAPTTPLNNLSVVSKAKEIQDQILPEHKAQTPEEKAIFDTVQMWGTAVPFANTNAMRSNILETIRTERAANGNTPTVARLTQLRQAIDDTIQTQLPKDQFDLWRTSQDAWRGHAETYKNQFVGPLLDTRPAGDYRVSETATPGRVIANNQSAQAFLDAGGSPQTLRGALIDDLAAKGPLTEEKLTKWRQDREGALRATPGLGDEVANVERAQTALSDLAATQAQAVRDAQQGKVATLLNANPADVPGIIGSTLSSRTAATQFMQMRAAMGGDRDAEAGLTKAVVDHFVNKVTNQQTGQINPAQFRQNLIDQAGALQAAGVTPEGMKTLNAIVDSLDRAPPGTTRTIGANKGGTPSSFSNMFRALTGAITDAGAKGSGTALGAAVVSDVMGPTLGTATGTVVLGRIGSYLHARGIRNTADVLSEAAANPAFGRTLLMAATPQNVPLAERAMQAALTAGRLGPAVSSYASEGEAQQRTRQRRLAPLLSPAAP